jgi:hypothetical protein
LLERRTVTNHAVRCRNCGAIVDHRRVELGYDYCTRDECQARCVKRVELTRVAVNKAADQIVRSDEVLPKGDIARSSIDAEPASATSEPRRTVTRRPDRLPPSTLERLEAAQRRLDDALRDVYSRFVANELTAAEMHKEQNKLIRAYNRLVMNADIRYRSMLRRQRSE